MKQLVKNLTRCCGPYDVFLWRTPKTGSRPGHFYKINILAETGKLTRCLHLRNVLLEVVSLLDDLIDHVVHGQPSLHVPAQSKQSKLDYLI